MDRFPDITKGDWVIDTNNPGRPGIFTGRTQRQGPFLMLEIEFGPGDRRFRPVNHLRRAREDDDSSILGRLRSRTFGKIADLRRLITFEKLKGTLHEIIYSMEAAQIDFLPYQFKPVLKFINSSADRLVVADEVGLGKTIESALIWQELQARKRAKRLLVLCPTHSLAKKWKDELREKFVIDAKQVNFDMLQDEIRELRRSGPGHAFALIATYSGLRPPRREVRHLSESPGESENLSPKTVFCQEIVHWDLDHEPFDLVVFDEAHYMRNPATSSFQLGESLAATAGAVLCVSATPVNNRSTDLQSLLRLVDDDFFRNQSMFDEILRANRPAVQLANALARVPVDMDLLKKATEGLAVSSFVGKSPLFKLLLEKLSTLDREDARQVAECQEIAEKLNILGGYISRTRRVQVKEHRPVRDPIVRELFYTPEEKQLYDAIIGLVRRRCSHDQRPFHIFQVIGLQMRAASSLPVFAAEVKSGKLGDARELLSESFDPILLEDDLLDDFSEEPLSPVEIDALLDYDYEANDSKFSELITLLTEILPNEKVVVFSFYRGTLNYLERRLAASGIRTAMIHGGISFDERDKVIEEFNSDTGPRVLLSSEVGSEGIDLQRNCRSLVNYDLPWNPMRVEQRIGRIDRVGQKAERLSIVHFKIAGTIEERIFERLHQRLALFANSLGDLESVIGEVVQQLTVDLLSRNLTPEMEIRRVEEAERVIERRLRDLQMLEESGESLLALSDYLQRKIDEDRGRGRYVQSSELESYLSDFFDHHFRGSHLAWHSPAQDCVRIRLTPEAHDSLAEYIATDRSLSARPLRHAEFAVTFRKDVHATLPWGLRRQVHFVNHLSPLVRWMTHIYISQGHRFFNVSAVRVADSSMPKGRWVYRVERWLLKGLKSQESLSYAVGSLDTGEILDDRQSELFMLRVLSDGREWDYPGIPAQDLVDVHEQLKTALAARLDESIAKFEAENQNTLLIRRERIENQFDRRISQDRQRIETLQRAGRSERVIALARARLQTAIRNRIERLEKLNRDAGFDVEKTEVAAGIVNIQAMGV